MKRLLSFILFILIATNVYAVTEFTATIKPSGGDYTTLATAEAGLERDLTSGIIKVFSISAATTPTIAAGDSVLGQTSGAKGYCVLVNAARTQILIGGISVAAFQSLEVVQKKAAAGVTVTLSNAGDSPIIGMMYDGDWSGGPGTTAVTVVGWTTSAANYIKIYTSATCRHAGKWDATKQVLSVANSIALNIWEEFVRLDGLQVEVNATNANNQHPIIIQSIAAGGSEFWISNCIFRGAASGTYLYTVLRIIDTDIVTAKVWNTICQHRGGTSSSGDYILNINAQNVYLGNLTLYGGYIGMRSLSSVTGTYYFRNVIATNTSSTDFYFATGPTYDVDYCASEDATADDKGGANNHISHTFSFAGVGNTDFHLTPADNGAMAYGTSMATDTNIPYSDDIDGRTRTAVWDIGADGVETFFDGIPQKLWMNK